MRPCAAILDAQGLRLGPDEKAFFRDANPFGFILFARNVDNSDQLRALCDEMRAAVGREAIITVDQEGGRVARLRPPLARDWPAPLDHVTRAGAGAARAMYLRYRLIAAELRGLGIDCNCAPMADLAGPDTHRFLKDRCYGSDAATVAGLARAVAQGLLDGGVLPVLKHLPGHGRASGDSHHDLPHVAAGAATLAETDFAAFRALSDLPMGMSAHVVYDALDGAAATISPAMIRVIREDIGFDGLLMSDDISMQALRGAPQENTRAALDAGCDVVLYCNGPLDRRRAVADAAGAMSEPAMRRAARALAERRAPLDFDVDAAEAELAGLTGGAGA